MSLTSSSMRVFRVGRRPLTRAPIAFSANMGGLGQPISEHVRLASGKSQAMRVTSEDDAQRVHVLGVGNIGRLFAHALATKEDPIPITLLFHREGLVKDWEESGKTIEIVTDGKANREGNYSVEVISSPEAAQSHIKNLIVTTKANKTASALDSIKHRLNEDSTILFAQNGMGTIEEVTPKIFPDVKTRPRYLNSVNSHGVYVTDKQKFSSTRAGIGYLALASPPPNPSNSPEELNDVSTDIQTRSPLMIRELISSPILVGRHVDSVELLCLQLEKLAINAMINPLTAIFNCHNGQLFGREAIRDLMFGLLRETCRVYRALPELAGSGPDVQDRLSETKLRKTVLDIAHVTRDNTSSMLQDVHAGRETEILYINDWIVRRGKRGGEGPEEQQIAVPCPLNQKLVRMVQDKVVIGVEQIEEYFYSGPGDQDKS